ncbi:Serine/threonine-protein kinase TOUSLED [Symbiodinium microadriaticum]|uniref:Serine/threonine-protein kinase TOUSLED n=1 Tax=Symbiodinium microadriaticum TaxID=2951 RepID=A0A1Q9CNL3_SYMMI|nr:Serine/threonine-protein kinase TOUSLED [Symbiodinium microadriaticum]CAE7885245.1 TOUSLED [Symbiodinium microadriaticum]
MDGADATADPSTPKHESRSRTDETSSGPPEEEPESTETSQAAAQPPTKPKAAENRRGSKRPHPPVPSLDPDQATVSPTISRGRKHRQTLTPEHGHDPEEAGCPKEREIKRLQQELNEQKTQMQNLINLAKKGRFMLADALVENAKNEREKLRVKLFHDGLRVGRYKTNLYGTAEWENGTEADAITALRKKLQQERDSVASLKLSLTKQSKSKAIETDDADANTEETDDLMEQREVCNHRHEYIRREDAMIKEREGRLMAERNAYLKNKHLVNAEDRSRFGHYPMLQDRFQLLNLIGKGGFSEIYKAFDLEMMCYCAIKLNEINSKMSNDMCKDAVRWALREAEIQKALQHPRIVQMRECFAVDNHAFVAVLELCEGETLDTRLKSTGPFSEKEAKTIIVQILTGLRYLNSAGRKIIHYDIKPSNVFYHAGQVKICDFGLSKMANHSAEGIIELSTRGAGTSWYLPPECHETASPTISSKVDVWSTGVVFFELLFNRRPFGDGQSQDAFRRSVGIEDTFELVIPTSPKVSNEAKEFLRRILTRDRDQRPDVLEVLQDPYIRKGLTDVAGKKR